MAENYIGRPPGTSTDFLTTAILAMLTGAIVYRHSVAAGMLRANGQVVLKATYPELWVYAQAFLTADQVVNPGLYRDVDVNNFAVPNLDGLFVRSQGGVSAALGVKQLEDFKSHNHPGSVTTNSYQTVGGGGPAYGSTAVGENGANGVTVAAQGGVETRPTNVALVPCIIVGRLP